MIFKCNLCGELMPYLNTPGDEINSNLICPRCANNIKKTLEIVKKKILDAFRHFPKLD